MADIPSRIPLRTAWQDKALIARIQVKAEFMRSVEARAGHGYNGAAVIFNIKEYRPHG